MTMIETTTLYVCPEGHNLSGTLERLTGTAFATPELFEGRIVPEYAGETDIDWDSQYTVQKDGEDVWICDNGDEYRVSQLLTLDAYEAASGELQ